MQKILLMIAALNAGGAERVIVTLANEWSKKNDVTILVFEKADCFYHLEDRVNVVAMNRKAPEKGIKRKFLLPFVEFERYCGICREIERGKYDFILSFCRTANIFASIASRLNGKKNIFISERGDPYTYSGIWKKIFFKIYRWNRGIICQNHMTKDFFLSHSFSNALPVLPNPLNYVDIPTKIPEKRAKEIVAVGRLIECKDHKLLIDAFDRIKDDYPEYTLKIFGMGPLYARLRKQIEERNLEKRVFLMGNKKRVMFEVNRASVFVLPSDSEGFPNVLIEAMATGMPVISSDFKTGIARELIKEGDNGYLFKPGSESGLVQALRRMLEREEDFYDMGEKNKKMAVCYREENIAKIWLEKINNLL